MCPFGWQLAQANVAVVDADAVSKAMRPLLTAGCVGSSSVTVSITFGLERSDTSTRDTVLATALSTSLATGDEQSILAPTGALIFQSPELAST